jgi:ribosome-associated toxin RatA of RatAB toxin-antitoxin module
MHKVHVSTTYNKSLPEIFAAISDHQSFLSGGGLSCRLIKAGSDYENGVGAMRLVKTNKHTLKEEITAFVENESYDYLIKEVTPPVAFIHHNGWLDFTEVGPDQVRVDWHTHYTFTQPIIGHFIGWLVKIKIKKIFLKRLNYLKK